ncbi:NAD(P)H-hydrate dehydratase, partial [Klebsiella pneumoniae]
ADNPEDTAQSLARLLGCTMVLKGAQTVVSDGCETFVCPPATHWLATAGTGDVLAGLMGGVIAQHAQELRAQQYNLVRIAAAA